jgi:Spy/CpxP family protein refolding chaperone
MRKNAIALAGAAVLALGAAVAQPGPMMGGYGPGGMMGGYGPGMMGGYGPGGMMGGYGYGLPDLTSEQRTKIAEIQREQRARHWPLMQQMQELMWADTAGSYDEQAQRRDYEKLAALQKQMFENSLETRKRIESVLTPQQRDEWRRGGRGGR